jgi:hypothetical protein
MRKDNIGALVLLAVVIAVYWLLRRYLPPVSCPHCGSGSWMVMNDMKQCRDCGSLFY